MDIRAYHNALNRGFSEKEAEKIGEEAWEKAQFMNRKHQEPDYEAFQNEEEAPQQPTHKGVK